MNELNLVKLLKGQEGITIYCVLFGNCTLSSVGDTIITVKSKEGKLLAINKNGKYLGDLVSSGEVIVFPSSMNRSWDNWVPPKLVYPTNIQEVLEVLNISNTTFNVELNSLPKYLRSSFVLHTIMDAFDKLYNIRPYYSSTDDLYYPIAYLSRITEDGDECFKVGKCILSGVHYNIMYGTLSGNYIHIPKLHICNNRAVARHIAKYFYAEILKYIYTDTDIEIISE